MQPSRINVAVRTRPCGWQSKCAVDMNVHGKEVSVQAEQNIHSFMFEKLLHEVSQQDVFESVGVDAIHAALRGVNSTIIAYGQTGAGKTHTLAGSRNSYQERGIIPRTLSYLLDKEVHKQQKVVTVSLRYVEIYNEVVSDLLTSSLAPITLIETKDHVIPHGATEQVVQNEHHALETFFRGEAARVTRGHTLNKYSSRSHAVCTIILSAQDDSLGPQVFKSMLTLVDLAGSERILKTHSEGIVLKEAGYINKSLTFLEQVAIAMSEGRQHIPYRSSKLTHLLKHALGGNSKTTFIANIWDDVEQLHETLSTLRFAQRMSLIETAISAKPAVDHEATIAELSQQVHTLKAALGDCQQTGVPGHLQREASLDPGEHLCQQVLNVLQSCDEHEVGKALQHINLDSSDTAKAALCAARLIYQRLTSVNQTEGQASSMHAPPVTRLRHDSPNAAGPGGILVPLGKACGSDSSGARGHSVAPQHDGAPAETASLSEALQYFKTHVAVGVEGLMRARAGEVAATKKRVKDLAVHINAEKHNIDQLRTGSTIGEQSGSAALEHSKAVYRALYEQLEQEKQELARSTESLERLKRDFHDRFRAWHAEAGRETACEVAQGADSATCASDCGTCDMGARHLASGTGVEFPALPSCATAPSLARHRPADYNSESSSFYDAQRRMEAAAALGSNKGKFSHLGQGWRICG
eukprot:jgi/Ulvmu1/3009/UM015_0049.1